jgi:hypothetical protein
MLPVWKVASGVWRRAQVFAVSLLHCFPRESVLALSVTRIAQVACVWDMLDTIFPRHLNTPGIYLPSQSGENRLNLPRKGADS